MSREEAVDPNTRTLELSERPPRGRSLDSHGLTATGKTAGLPAPDYYELNLERQRSRLLSQMFGIEAEAQRIGGYVVLEELGRGGMGVVYSAYDRKLDRKLALKLMLPRARGTTAQARFLREAQALAKLSHPNIIQIHEVGTTGEAVYIAMEFVAGQTLSDWAHADGDGRHWRELLDALIQAGRGLEAAHQINLVHRDFKPENAIVGDDGRVRVLDFGLVRGAEMSLDESEFVETDESAPTARTEDAAGVDVSSAQSGLKWLGVELTVRGTVMGTPVYMAPEQHLGTVCGPSADQYSFCVAAFELLFGVRPFTERTMKALLQAKRLGALPDIGHRRDIPKTVRAAIIRGLSPRPSDRWPDLSALLAELERGRARSGKSWLAWGGAVIGLALGVGAATLGADQPHMCEFDESALTELWTDEDRSVLHAMLASREPEHADRAIEVIDRGLTRWGTQWLDSQRRVCEATHVLGSQSEALLDLRAACLERKRREAAAIVQTLTRADGAGVGYAVQLLDRLPDTQACEDPHLAENSYPEPSEQRESILAAYEQISHARSLLVTNRFDEAEGLIGGLEAMAADLDHLPLSLEVRFVAAQRLFERHQTVEAVPLLREVIRESEIAGLDELSADARTYLANQTIGWWGSVEQQTAVLEEAEIAVARIGRPDDRRAADLALDRALLLQAAAEFEKALVGYRASIEHARERGDLGLMGPANFYLARLLKDYGSFEEAEQTFLAARSMFEDTFGPIVAARGEIEIELGVIDLERGRFDEAAKHLADARELLEPSFDPSTGYLILLESAEAKLLFLRGDLEGARERFARIASVTTDAVRQGEAWDALGVICFYLDDIPGSLDAYRRAETSYMAAFGEDHPTLGLLSSNIGESLAASGDHQGALEAYARALRLLERNLREDHPDLALPYKGRGQTKLALGNPRGARSDLERALALHEANPGEPIERADVEFALARALFAMGEHERASELATVAHHRFDEAGYVNRAHDITAWLDQASVGDHR